MSERTERGLKALSERFNGNLKWVIMLAALGGGGGVGAYAREILGGEAPVNKELIEHRIGEVEKRLDRIEHLLDERLPR